MSSKTDEELQKEKEEKQKILREIDKELLKDKIKKEREKKEKQEIEEKKLKLKTKKCNLNETEFAIKIKYKCESVCGKKYYIYNSNNEMFPFIDKNDIILYDNPSHSNHNREAVVIKYTMKGEGSKEIDKNKTRPYFLIKFIEPVDKLPFYHLDVNGAKIKTNKKIIFIDNVPYQNMKLVYSANNGDDVCLPNNIIDEAKEDLNKLLNKRYNKKNLNAPLEFKEFIENVFRNIKDITSKIDKEKIIKEGKTVYRTEKEFSGKMKRLVGYVKKYNPEGGFNGKEKKVIDRIIDYFDKIFNHTFSLGNVDNPNSQLKSKEELILYIFIYDNLQRKAKKLIKFITDFKEMDTSKDKEKIDAMIGYIKKCKENFVKVKEFFKLNYERIFKENDEDIDSKIMKIVIKNLIDIKMGIQIKPYTYKNFILDEIKLKIGKYFKLDTEFTPAKVYLKYANKEIVKNELKDKQEDKKQLISLDNKKQLVNPTPDKIFILSNINSVFNKNSETKSNDIDNYFDNNININFKNNQIDIKLQIGLTIKDKKSKETILKDETKGKKFTNSIRDFVDHFKSNLDCEVSKENVRKDIDDIKKRLGIYNENTNEQPTDDTSIE